MIVMFFIERYCYFVSYFSLYIIIAASMQNPGIQVILTRNGPSSADDAVSGASFETLYRNYLQTNLTQVDIAMDDQQGSDQDAKYNLTELYMTSISYLRPANIKSLSAGALVNLRRVSAHILGKWKYTRKTWTDVQDSGYIRINLSGGRARLLKPSHTPPVPGEIRCSVNFNDVGVTFVSRSGYLFERLGKLIEAQMGSVAEKTLCDILTSAMATSLQDKDKESTTEVATSSSRRLLMQTAFYFGPKEEIALNYSLLSPSIPKTNFIILKMKGEFELQNQTSADRYFMHAPSFPVFNPDEPQARYPGEPLKSLAIYFVADYVPNTLSNLLFQTGRLGFYVSEANLNGNIFCPLSDCLSLLFSEASQLAGSNIHNVKTEAMVSAINPPEVLVTKSNGVELWMKLRVRLYLRNGSGDNKSAYLGTVKSHIRYNLALKVASNRIKCSATLRHASEFEMLDTAFHVTRTISEAVLPPSHLTSRGALEVGSKKLFESLNEIFLYTMINNDICDFGLPLPVVKGEVLKLSDPDLIMYHSRYIVLTTQREGGQSDTE